MKNYHIESICSYFKLGTPIKPPKRIYGGLLHIMWHLQTDKSIYAVKQLSRDINLSDDHIIENYNLTEHIASQFIQKGIPACAMEKADFKQTRLSQDPNHLIMLRSLLLAAEN